MLSSLANAGDLDRRVGKGALAPCPPSIGSLILNGGHAFRLRSSSYGARFCPPYALKRDSACGRPPCQRERKSEAGNEKPGALPQTLNENRPAYQGSASACGYHDHDDVRGRVQRHRDQAERDERKRRVTRGWIQELRNERQEE